MKIQIGMGNNNDDNDDNSGLSSSTTTSYAKPFALMLSIPDPHSPNQVYSLTEIEGEDEMD